MLDYNLLRYELNKVAKKLSRRKFFLDVVNFRKQEKKRKMLQIKVENLQFKRNIQSKLFGKNKNCGKNVEKLHEEIKNINECLKIAKYKLNLLKKKIYNDMLSFPNIPDNFIPDGYNIENNVEIFRWGIPKKFNFSIKDHMELGKILDGLDFSSSVKLVGSRFVVMKGKIACMHRALIQFMLDVHIKKHGYQEYLVPYLSNITSLYGSCQLPLLSNEMYYVNFTKKSKINNTYALIPTAEVPLINLMKDKIFEEKMLPIKIISHTPCFRSEAGSYGSNNQGLIRMHQFDKVEIVQVVKPEKSMEALEEITSHAEKILKLLNLPYRKIILCAGDLGFSSCKTYDLEVWLPSHNNYCEISSCSNTGDFQSRRIKARYRKKNNSKLQFVHMLNGSGLAISRTLAAILENYQLSNGFVEVPLVLRDYMDGLTYIK
ncbi:MAG: serine--tRNA ligase [Candidatus Westeberhardia cardiocondylae]|nr:serine--tRNA ligase [Candidatus Westeberhardia cardiocondylae]